MSDPVVEPVIGPTADPPTPEDIARGYGLPEGWAVTTGVEIVPSPVDINMTHPRSTFARMTTIVTDSLGGYIASSGDQQDAANQGLAYCQSKMAFYSRDAWPYP